MQATSAAGRISFHPVPFSIWPSQEKVGFSLSRKKIDLCLDAKCTFKLIRIQSGRNEQPNDDVKRRKTVDTFGPCCDDGCACALWACYDPANVCLTSSVAGHLRYASPPPYFRVSCLILCYSGSSLSKNTIGCWSNCQLPNVQAVSIVCFLFFGCK